MEVKFNLSKVSFPIKEKIHNPRNLMKIIVYDAQQFCTRAFARQGLYRPNAWGERRDPNIAGIFSDANLPGSGAIKTRRLDVRPVLMDTARLSRSIKGTVTADTRGVVGTNVPYAKVHNEGGYSTQTRTNYDTFNKKIDKFVRVQMKNYGDIEKAQVLSLKQADELETRVRKRQFIGYPIVRFRKLTKEYMIDSAQRFRN